MALSAFDDKSRPPADSDLAATLGNTHALWNELRVLIFDMRSVKDRVFTQFGNELLKQFDDLVTTRHDCLDFRFGQVRTGFFRHLLLVKTAQVLE